MLDIKFISNNLTQVKNRLATRNYLDVNLLDHLVEEYHRQRQFVALTEQDLARKNSLSREFGEKKRRGEDTTTLTNSITEIDVRIAQSSVKVARLEGIVTATLQTIPNLPDDDLPAGGEINNRVISEWGSKPELSFSPQGHEVIGAKLNIFDFERAAKLSGSRFVILKGSGCRLERALSNFMIDCHTKNNYKEIYPPLLVKPSALYQAGQLPKFQDSLFVSFKGNEVEGYLPCEGLAVDMIERRTDLYRKMGEFDGQPMVEYIEEAAAEIKFESVRLSKDNNPYCLIPTAEVPLTAMHANEILNLNELPIRYVSQTPCFRSEAGSYGRDVKGILRQHQFQKVELFKITHPDESANEHEELTKNAEQILQKLGLHYRKVLLAAGDMGFAAQRTYDLEVWVPSQDTFREISSCSNCGDFQARRAKIRFKDESKKNRFVHTLNGSGLAVGRTLIAILENYQQADGSVVVPEVLRPYMGGLEKIGP